MSRQLRAANFIPNHELITPQLRKLMRKIIDHPAEYEPYGSIIDWKNPAEQRDLHLILDIEGVYSQELIELLVRYTKKSLQTLTEYAKSRKMKSMAAGRLSIQFGDPQKELITRLCDENRNIAASLLLETYSVSYLYVVRNAVRSVGIEQAYARIRTTPFESGIPDSAAPLEEIWNWFSLVHGYRLRDPLPVPLVRGRFSHTEVVQLLKEIDLQPTGSMAVRSRFRHI